MSPFANGFRDAMLAILLTAAPALASAPQPTYVGSQVCGECHQVELERWRGSYHDLAMTEATEETVLGDFDGVEFTAHGVTSRFFRKDGDFMVRTDGPDGELHDYPVPYTFGWWPLQQYLIPLPGGRLQSLGIAWDSRAKDAGGQRWFHLYPDEPLDHRHDLHWTSRDQNWNYQCAECHSTHLKKGYDLATDSFSTTWSEIDVACEACHGPASGHLEQARLAAAGGVAHWDKRKGLVVDLADRDGGHWIIDAETQLPRRSVSRKTHTQINICARCHSRRGQISEHYVYGRPLGDTHRLALLDEGLYYPDGQIQGEVYVHGSFIQSRMFAQGVTCTDCHDPHSLKLKAERDQVCAQCHLSARYATQAHHHHDEGSAGASCTACHMPQRAYMVIDERADHSLRIPRPDLTIATDSPNACNGCHADKSAEWALEAYEGWYGKTAPDRPHYGQALHAGRVGATEASHRLIALAGDEAQPAIARATALDLLHQYPDPTHMLTFRRLLQDRDPLVRAAAVRYLDTANPPTLMELGFPLLADPILAVRTEAARTLAPLAAMPLPDGEKVRLDAALEAYRASQLVNAERAESHLNIGLVEAAANRPEAAEKAYRTAIRLDPKFGPAYVNLADLFRTLGRDQDGETLLQQGLAVIPQDASLYYALGLLQIRAKALPQAVGSLTRAAALDPDNPRYSYVQALALQGAGDLPKALAILDQALERHPTDRDILFALVTFNQQSGNLEAARDYAARLKALK
ncbi:tetratricopeptide repeat protein [Thiorhodococcus mannitoliphagus]|uniref:Tetratricopeptide repeat protein n=1 Tax=Thiorhodococcus mannitoliphagus TaxID=329406 RepID=A0A6P1DYE7_9GAMM|nr:tetratricopeptide repeat protein [Thiorhodococcus mannitoliphagus]NEX22719.1 tetratricopeptide repeat protein [Thiorhodococcus mannitoliphagus]